jgi:2-polyprenyl-3-methyl-5-hydroxy-6-metoxy-1,4-benzoquinol methylase
LQSTKDVQYTNRLNKIEQAWWRRYLDPQIPYRYNLRRLNPGFMLDVGCGLGRNLLNNGGRGVGVDHNQTSVEVCRSRGLEAYTSDDFTASRHGPGSFDSLLLAHVVEHMTLAEDVALIRSYLEYVRKGGKVIIIAPQEAGYRSDPTHVEFMDIAKITSILREAGVKVERAYSFPFPRLMGKCFMHNEFVVVGTVS